MFPHKYIMAQEKNESAAKAKNSKSMLLRTLLLRTVGPSAVVLLIAVLFFALIFSMTASNAMDTQLHHQQEKITQRMEETTQQLLRIDYLQRQLINSNEFTKLAYMYDDIDWYTRYQLLNDMKQRMWETCDTHEYCSQIYMSVSSIDKIISGKAVNAHLPEYISLDKLPEASSPVIYDGKLVNIVVRSDDSSSQKPSVLAAVIDTDKIKKAFEYSLLGGGDYILLSFTGSEDNSKADFTVASSIFPISISYFAAKSSSNAFIEKILFISVMFIVTVLIAEVIALSAWYRQVYRPLQTLLVDAFGKAEEGDYSYRIITDEASPFAGIYESYNHMMEKTESYVETNLKQQILVSRANLKQLQSQISPHFMYNSYYVLYRLIKKGDQEGSMKLAEQLGQFYQYVTRNADDEKHLDEEVAHAKNYAAIQKFRFKDAIDMEIDDPDEEIAKTYVPRLILQPLLENVFKYAYDAGNSALNDDGVIKLKIRYEVEDSHHFSIIVENSGDITDETILSIQDKLNSTDETIETTALVNIHRRLRIYYGDMSGLSVERSPLGGLLVRMNIMSSKE